MFHLTRHCFGTTHLTGYVAQLWSTIFGSSDSESTLSESVDEIDSQIAVEEVVSFLLEREMHASTVSSEDAIQLDQVTFQLLFTFVLS